jgi:hypothetical protein
MTPYSSETPRAALALAALALTALTIGTLVVMPASLDPGPPATTLAARGAPAAPEEVAISPALIHVIALREPNVAWALDDRTRPNCKPDV